MPIDGRSPRLAILIDADNTGARHARAIFEEIANLGEANVRRIYGDFSNDRLKGWRDVMQPLAIEPQQQFNYTTGKNAADIALVIDAMDLLHRGGLDGFCLVSSDSDFTRLATRLREDGTEVYGIGAKKTPEAFRNACSRFIYIENLPAAAADKGTAAAPRAPAMKKLPKKTPSKKKAAAKKKTAAKKEPPTKIVPLVLKAMKQASDDEDWIDLAEIGHHLGRDFDPRIYGSDKLITVVEKTGQFEIERLPGGRVRIKRR